jgi:hypothetical protein
MFEFPDKHSKPEQAKAQMYCLAQKKREPTMFYLFFHMDILILHYSMLDQLKPQTDWLAHKKNEVTNFLSFAI